MAATAKLIDDDLQTLLRAATISGIVSAKIVVKEIVSINEDIVPQPPCILIVPFKGKPSEPLGTEGSAGRTYWRQVVLIDGTEGDFETDKPARELRYEQARDAIERNGTEWRTALPSVTTVWDIAIDETTTFDRSKLPENWAVEWFAVKIQSSE